MFGFDYVQQGSKHEVEEEEADDEEVPPNLPHPAGQFISSTLPSLHPSLPAFPF